MKSEDFEAKLSVWVAAADKDKLGSRGSSAESASGSRGLRWDNRVRAASLESKGEDSKQSAQGRRQPEPSTEQDRKQARRNDDQHGGGSGYSESSDEEEGSESRHKNEKPSSSKRLQQTWGQRDSAWDPVGVLIQNEKKKYHKQQTPRLNESEMRGRSAEPTANSTQKGSGSIGRTPGAEEASSLHSRLKHLQRETAEQQETIQRLEDENYDLRSQLFDAKDAQANLEIELAQAQKQKSKSGTKPTQYTEDSMGDEREVSELTHEASQLKKNLASKNALLRLQTEEMTAMGKRVEVLSQEVAKLNVLLSESEEDKQKLLQEAGEVARKEIDMLRGHMEDLQNGLEAAVRRAEQSERGWNDSESRLRLLRDEFERYKAEAKNQQDRAETGHQEVVFGLRRELEDTRRNSERRESDALRKEREALNREKDRELQSLQSRLEVEIKERDKEIEILKQEVQTSRLRLEEEVQKVHSLSHQQIEMLKSENKDLDKRVMEEIRKRHLSEEKLRARDRAERDAVLLGVRDREGPSQGTPSRNKSSSRKQTNLSRSGPLHEAQSTPSSVAAQNHLVHELEQQLSAKTHEVIDLTAANNSLCRRLAAAEQEQGTASRRAVLLEQELGFLKEKHAGLQERVKYLQTAESVQEKTEFEVLRELNDLREAVQRLKEERDKILRMLGFEGFQAPKLFAEVSTEVFLGMVEQLSVQKKELGVELHLASTHTLPRRGHSACQTPTSPRCHSAVGE